MVFEGDELFLRCRAPRVAAGAPRDSEDLPTRAYVFWGWSSKILNQNSTDDITYVDPSKKFTDVQLETKQLTDSGILDSILRISNIKINHSGMWDCTLRSEQITSARTVQITVISNSTIYCPNTKVYTNKGNYFWPRTVRGELVYQSCVEDTSSDKYATYQCDENGNWLNLNIGNCYFVSETTRILEQFSKVNFTATKGSATDFISRLHNLTQYSTNLIKIKDPLEIDFIATTLINCINNTQEYGDIQYLLLDIISQLLLVPRQIFKEAQKLYSSGVKLLSVVEKISPFVQFYFDWKTNPKYDHETNEQNLYVDYFEVEPISFSGLSCFWLKNNANKKKRTFECTTENNSFPLFGKQVNAAIHIPQNLMIERENHVSAFKLVFFVYSNANLLPQIPKSPSESESILTSAVVGVKIIDYLGKDLKTNVPILIILREHPFHNKQSAPLPVFWDKDLEAWSSDPCREVYTLQGLTFFSCNQIGYYGLLQQKKYLNDLSDENAGALFRIFPLVIYVGSGVLFLSSWINIAVYITFGSLIQIKRQQRHSLINTWIAISTLCAVFSIGILQSENYLICKSVGILIHYFSLCVILWHCVSISNMYKRLSKKSRIVTVSDVSREAAEKPILGIYLVGWGIGMIICGISGAVNMDQYITYHYCFLSKVPALNAIIVPSVIILMFLTILYICIFYHIKKKTVNDFQQNSASNMHKTENIDLTWMEPSNSSFGRTSKSNNFYPFRSSTLSNSVSCNVGDYERTYSSQLKAHLLFLVLFLLSWASAAAFTVLSTNGFGNSKFFSVAFAVFSSFLGLFLFIYYTLSRQDVKIYWNINICCCVKRNKNLREHFDGANEPIINVIHRNNAFDANNSGTRSNSQCSKNRSSSIKSGASCYNKIEKNSFSKVDNHNSQQIFKSTGVEKNYSSNMNITSSLPTADIFYNPNQINVARKFFKKQKRLLKRNNFDLQRQVDKFDLVSNSILLNESVYYSKKHNAMTILSSDINVKKYELTTTPSKTLSAIAECCTQIPTITKGNCFRKTTDSNVNLVANIYTNIPETHIPEHEIVNVRLCSTLNPLSSIKALSEDEEEESHNTIEINSFSKKSLVDPLYANTSERVSYTPVIDFQKENGCVLLNNTAEVNGNCFGLKLIEMLEMPNIHNKRNAPDIIFSAMHTKSISIPSFEQKRKKLVDCKERSMSCNDLFQSSKDFWLKPYSANISNETKINKIIFNVIEEKNKFNFDETKNSSEIFHDSRTISVSPTNESDLNYQNSEISIRSHGLYAPQGDNDFNLTLTDDYPYHSSEISEIDDILIASEDDENNCKPISNTNLLRQCPGNAINESLDELYKAIKKQNYTQANYSASSSFKSGCTQNCLRNTKCENTSENAMFPTSEQIQNNLEDDSSQESVIIVSHDKNNPLCS